MNLKKWSLKENYKSNRKQLRDERHNKNNKI